MYSKINLSQNMDSQALQALVILLNTADQINKTLAQELAKKGQSASVPYLDDLIDKASRGGSVTQDELELMKQQMTTIYTVFKDSDEHLFKVTADGALTMLRQLRNL